MADAVVPPAAAVAPGTGTGPRWERWLALGLSLVVFAAALGLRLWQIESLPHGMHGDEAGTGLEAQRVLREGWIGPYSPVALGRPTLPIYLTAPAVVLFGNTLFAVRFVPALMGALSVLLAFEYLRRRVDLSVALATAAVLAALTWHLHISRIAFHVSTWGFVALALVVATLEALRTADWRWWISAGALAGLGIYAYQAHWLLLGVMALFLGAHAFAAEHGPGRALVALARAPSAAAARIAARRAVPLALFGAALLVVALPTLLWAADPRNGYFNSFQLLSSLNKPEAQGGEGGIERLLYFVGRYVDLWARLCCRREGDTVDGSGEAALVHPALFVLATLGAGAGLWRQRSPLVLLPLTIVLLMPLAYVVTVDAPARRTFALVPVLAAFAAVGLVAIVRFGRFPRAALHWGVLACALAALAWQHLHVYFGVLPATPAFRFAYAREFVDAVHFMKTLPPTAYVYFYSGRWSINYEPRLFLAPEVRGEDRSGIFNSPQRGTLADPRLGTPVYLFVGPFPDDLAEAQRRYPGGRLVRSGPEEPPAYVAYLAPPEAAR